MYHHMRRLVENRELAIEWIKSSAVLTDSPTKALSIGLFKKYQDKWSLVDEERICLKKESTLKVQKMQKNQKDKSF